MNRLRKFSIRFSAIILIVVIFSILMTASREAEFKNDGKFVPIRVAGEISVDGGAYQTLDADREFDLDHNHYYRIKGHFTQDIGPNHQIMMRISDLWVRIHVNGQEVFAFGKDKEHSAGNVWQTFTSPGITTQDLVEIEITNVYTSVHPLSINQFLNEMHYGSMDGLYKMTFSQNGFSMLIGFLIFVIGICEGVIAVILFLVDQEGAVRIFYSAAFAISSGVWFCIQFNIISMIIPYPLAVATADVFSPYLMSAFFALYISTYLSGKLQLFGQLTGLIVLWYTLACLAIVLLLKIDAYRTISVGWALAIADLITSLIYLGLEYCKKHDRTIRFFLLSLAPIFLGTMMDAIGYWSGRANETIWLRSCFLLFVMIQMVALIFQLRENTKKAERMENELIQNRISIMLSQIQPHFLYNTLTAISRLCSIDSHKAEQAIIGLSSYLRGNLDSLLERTLVPFERELEHTKMYLSMEKMRYEDKLTVLYDITVSDFKLPALTIEPLVENAVRYGVGRLIEGGTVSISTKETDEAYVVLVKDNGAGFDSAHEKADGRSHIGIENVRGRLKAQCNGKLIIKSEIDFGTTAVVVIPKE